ncbi:MAG: CAP domain-containing protein [Actinomycetota bacterium]|nr:CAP domain-containing protein [Actinomycetota bacterium]
MIASVVAVVLSAAAPSGASATGQCLYQGEAVGSANLERAERSLLCLTNVHRLRGGAPALSRDSRLAGAAEAHSSDMAARGYFGHLTPEGISPSDRALAAGFPGGAGENIVAGGSPTAIGIFELWRGSGGHNTNMLNTGYRSFGGGISPRMPSGNSGITATQMFGLVAANSRYTALDLYASSPKCAKAKRTRLAFLAQGVSENGKLNKFRERIKKACRPPT